MKSTSFSAEGNSYVGQTSVIWDIAPSARLAATIAAGTTALAEFQLEGLLRFSYGYQVDFGREVAP